MDECGFVTEFRELKELCVKWRCLSTPDALPPYEELDRILEGYVEHDQGVQDMIGLRHSPDTVRKVVAMIHRNEYKRRQGPIGVKITPRAFGRDWRLPIVNRFREK